MSVVLGVDGGNTKTDYLLHDLNGHLIAHLRAGTCSHESLSMEGAKREMGARIGELLQMARLGIGDVAAGAFGLAGIDQPLQQRELTRILREIGFVNFIAMNDSFLGIKAGSESGIGICSINGTGTASGGIDRHGNWMQVGGLGKLSGDYGGGQYIAEEAILGVYNAIFRFGEATGLVPPMLSLFHCDAPDDFHVACSTEFATERRVTAKEIIDILFQQSTAGDPVSRRIVTHVAEELARSAAGCAVRLQFEGVIPVVLIGSVWTKGRHQPMIDHFQEVFCRLTKRECRIILLEAPPAAGSVLWALELALKKMPVDTLRETVIRETMQLDHG